jgi:predicted RNA-binding protein YlqC (UPF0109 family)
MKELIEYIARSLVDHPERVEVRERLDGEDLVYVVSVAEGEAGKVIGRQGRVVKAIRTLATAAAWKENRRVRIEVV